MPSFTMNWIRKFALQLRERILNKLLLIKFRFPIKHLCRFHLCDIEMIFSLDVRTRKHCRDEVEGRFCTEGSWSVLADTSEVPSWVCYYVRFLFTYNFFALIRQGIFKANLLCWKKLILNAIYRQPSNNLNHNFFSNLNFELNIFDPC